MMIDLDALEAGVYRHYKGPLYLVLGYAHDANADTLGDTVGLDQGHEPCVMPLGERAVVVYVGLQLDAAHTGPRLAVRSVEDFFAPVCHDVRCPDYGHHHGCRSYNHTMLPRFQYVGPTWEGSV